MSFWTNERIEDAVLICEDLCKSYPGLNKPVLDRFCCQIPKGKIIGLLGPNGCGKSTLIKLITGLLVADRGEIYIDGKRRSEKTNALISYLPERTYFNNWMRVEELLTFFAEFYEDFDMALARKMLGELQIDTNAKLKALSKGTKEKVQLVLVMARKAKLYLLDEPIAGVDPRRKRLHPPDHHRELQPRGHRHHHHPSDLRYRAHSGRVPVYGLRREGDAFRRGGRGAERKGQVSG